MIEKVAKKLASWKKQSLSKEGMIIPIKVHLSRLPMWVNNFFHINTTKINKCSAEANSTSSIQLNKTVLIFGQTPYLLYFYNKPWGCH